MVKYTVIIEKAKNNYSAYCPDLPGVIAAGQTKEKTIEKMREAIKFHLEGLKRENMDIPKPSTQATDVEVSI
jgi:predicted RNase H-like HicB family nuclease